MSEQSLAIPRLHAEISQTVVLTMLWTFVGLSLVTMLARCYIKLKTFKRINPDDIIALTAWFLFLANAIIWTVMGPRLYENYDALQGKRPYDLVALERYGEFLHCIAPMTSLFYTSLWSVKLSMLLFFRRLGEQIRSHEIWWRCVTAFTIASWLVCVIDIDWNCTTKPLSYIMAHCSTQSKIDYQNTTFYINCALDILSDTTIISIPVLILWNTRVPLRKKLVLLAIFSITVVVMVISVIRVKVVDSRHQSSEIAWLLFWSYVENGTAIMISCAASFRQLFVATQEDHSSSPYVNQTFSLKFLRATSRGEESYRARNHGQHSLDSGRSKKKILSSDGIQIRSSISVTTDTFPGQHAVFERV